MNRRFFTFILISLLSGRMACAAEPEKIDPVEVTATLKKVADWQLATSSDVDLLDWVIAPLYDGLIATAKATGDPKYLAAVLHMGTQVGWAPGGLVYHADHHAVGHAWLDLYLLDRSHPERLLPFKKRFDAILAKPIAESLAIGRKPSTPGVAFTDRWTWSDALYMAPPTLARLAEATGDRGYLEFLDREYLETYDKLFDPKENLFYRDERFIGQKTPNGEKVFWSRGNGWVFAGLPLIIDELPDDYPNRKFYVDLFQKMAPAILATQQSDGLWYPSLKDPKQVAIGETSGSAFFVYGLAWGVRHGLLDRSRYWPAVVRGWNALLTRIDKSGAVGFVQRIGDAPDHLDASSRQLYGTGGVLMAGSEILQALDAGAKIPPADLMKQAEALLADDHTPRAYARLVPERKDDLSWENDKIGFRVYGPALRNSVEAAGIDVWAKKVAYLVLDKWYADDASGRASYHKDHGEGYDGFAVGDSSGCGGVGLWQAGKVISADVYDQAQIIFTAPDLAEFKTRSHYPEVDGKSIVENRVVRLRMGKNFNEITVRFTVKAPGNPPARDLAVAIGLITQTPKGEITLDPKAGLMAVSDRISGGEPLGTAVLVPPGTEMLQQDHSGSPRLPEALAILHTDAKGEIHYRAGAGLFPKEEWRKRTIAEVAN